MDRASLEPAIKLIIAEIHLKLDAANELPRLPRPLSWQAASVKALKFRWILSS